MMSLCPRHAGGAVHRHREVPVRGADEIQRNRRHSGLQGAAAAQAARRRCRMTRRPSSDVACSSRSLADVVSHSAVTTFNHPLTIWSTDSTSVVPLRWQPQSAQRKGSVTLCHPGRSNRVCLCSQSGSNLRRTGKEGRGLACAAIVRHCGVAWLVVLHGRWPPKHEGPCTCRAHEAIDRSVR